MSIVEPDWFKDEADFYTPEQTPTFINYERSQPPADEPAELTLRLVGKSPLWGHLLWNAGRVSAEYIETHRDELRGKTVLELGAAAALPALLASFVAKNVVATDFPDNDLIENIDNNIALLQKSAGRPLPLTALGYTWGHDVTPLLEAPGQGGAKFDFIILSDLVFNHSEHAKLLKTCRETLAPKGEVLVVFTPHRPHLFEKDKLFFTAAEQDGFNVRKIIERKMQPMFEEDEETREIRSMVYGYILTLEQSKN